MGPCQHHPQVEVASGLLHLGETEAGASFYISLRQHRHSPSEFRFHLCLCLVSLVTGSGNQPWRERGKGRKGVQGPKGRRTLTRYFPLAPRSVPSLSQVTMGLGFPKAVQVMVTLPPSLASMYWGGVSVKVGGAAKRQGGVSRLLPCLPRPSAPGPTPRDTMSPSARCEDAGREVETAKILCP